MGITSNEFGIAIMLLLSFLAFLSLKKEFKKNSLYLKESERMKKRDETILWLIKNKSFSIGDKTIENVQLINTHTLACWVTTEKIFFYEMDNCIYAGGYCIFNQYFDNWEIDENYVEIKIREYLIRIPFQKEWEGYEPYILNSKYS